jgi:hypothetical protein
VATRCWIALPFGKDETDPLFLQIKEAEESVLEPRGGKSEYANHELQGRFFDSLFPVLDKLQVFATQATPRERARMFEPATSVGA